MIFFSLISTAFSSIFYGLIATIAIIAIIYFALKAFNPGIVQTPVFYITGALLVILLLIQTSLMFGAMQAKDTADTAQQYISGLIENYQGIANAEESRQAIDAIADEFPIIGNFVDLTAFYGQEIADLPASIHATVTNYLNYYIWHRIWWMLGVIIVSCLTIILFSKPAPDSNYSRMRHSALPSRDKDRRARTGSHQRVSRRR